MIPKFNFEVAAFGDHLTFTFQHPYLLTTAQYKAPIPKLFQTALIFVSVKPWI